MTEDKDFQAVNEIGKIFNSFLEKTLLCDFLIESSLVFVKASEGYLFLAGAEDKLWMETAVNGSGDKDGTLLKGAEEAFRSGKTDVRENRLYVPLIVRNSIIGVTCFIRDPKAGGSYSEKEISLAFNLSSQGAVALKNILLYEQTLKMERLAAIGQAMGMVLHEIKNIIQLASFSQEYLKIGVAKQNPKFLNIGIEGVGKAIKEMDGFSYEILSLTKDYKISPQAIDWAELLKELGGDLFAKANQFKIELGLECDPLLGSVEGESRSLYRMLLNIIKNAMEAADSAKEKSIVRVRIASKDPEFYEITVEDNGKGMNDETKAKLFQAFFSTKGEKGTGLGLLIIDRTIKAHHGKIQVESEFGKGAKFILTLPKKLPR